MATESTPDKFRGLMISDERISLWEAQSSFSQAGPSAGIPEPQQSTRATLRSSGTATADKAYRIRSLRGGYAGAGASWVWRAETELSSQFRGWNPPSSISGFEAVRWTDGTGDLKWTRNPHSITTAAGLIVVAHSTRDTARAKEYGIEVSIRSTAGVWSHVLVEDLSNDVPSLQMRSPALVVLPSGRLLCLFWIFDTAITKAQIRMHYSDDDGATWSLGEPAVLSTMVDYSTTEGSAVTGYLLGRIRAAYSAGAILLVAQLRRADTDATCRDTFNQWASTDLGSRFTEVETWGASTDNGGNYHEILSVDGGFCFMFMSMSDLQPKSRIVSSAFSPLSDADDISIPVTEQFATKSASGTHLTDGDLSCCRDTTGNIYAYPRRTYGVTSDVIGCFMSSDGGRVWTAMGQSSINSTWSTVWNPEDTGTHPRDYSVTAQGGRIVMLHNWDATPADEDESLGALYLGGWTSVTLPAFRRFPVESKRAGYEYTWIPYERPSDVGWTAQGTGTDSLTAGYLEVTTSSNFRRFNRTPTGTATEGLIIFASFAVISGGPASTDRAGLRARCESAGVGYIVDIQCSTTTLVVRDEVAGSDLSTLSSGIDLTTGIDLMIGLGSGTCSVWWRQRDLSEDQLWNELVKGVSVSDNSGATGTHLIEFGNRQGGTAVTRWFNVCYSSDEWTGTGLSSLQTNPDDLLGRDYSSAPSWMNGGTFIQANNGSTVRGDEWKVSTRYDHEISRALVSGRQVSPRIGWRSTSTAEQILSFQITALADTTIGGGLLGVGLFGTNIGQVEVSGYDLGTSTWVSLGTAEASEGLSPLDYVREGDTVRPSALTPVSPPEPFLHSEELVDGYFFLGSGVSRTIRAHNQGKWTSSETTRSVLELSDVDGGDPTAGSAGAIIPRNWSILVDMKGERYSGIRLTIPTPAGSIPAPPQSFWEIGTLIVGAVVLHGDQYSWGRTIETVSGTELLEARDRTTRSRVTAPPHRVISYQWSDGIDTSESSNPAGNPDPSFAAASDHSSSEGVTVIGSTALQMDGVARRLNGSDSPVVYLPRVARFSAVSPVAVLNRRSELVLGRIITPVQIESVQGEELEDEVVRVATVTIREEV